MIKRYKKKKELRAIKSTYKPSKKIQTDVKKFKDILNILEYSLKLSLKKQKEPINDTARDIKTCALFNSFAYRYNHQW